MSSASSAEKCPLCFCDFLNIIDYRFRRSEELHLLKFTFVQPFLEGKADKQSPDHTVRLYTTSLQQQTCCTFW